MQQAPTNGIDLAWSGFQLRAVDADGVAVLKRKLRGAGSGGLRAPRSLLPRHGGLRRGAFAGPVSWGDRLPDARRLRGIPEIAMGIGAARH